MIPAKFYLPMSDAEQDALDSKYQKNKRSRSQKQKEAEERKLQSKAAKLSLIHI